MYVLIYISTSAAHPIPLVWRHNRNDKNITKLFTQLTSDIGIDSSYNLVA